MYPSTWGGGKIIGPTTSSDSSADRILVPRKQLQVVQCKEEHVVVPGYDKDNGYPLGHTGSVSIA